MLVFALAITTVVRAQNIELGPDERLVTILGTNDIHGGIEPNFPMWAGMVDDIRQRTKDRYDQRAGVLTVDAGDQFQGTLISNYTEGMLIFAAMKLIQYDAIVPGNHDYDFGPIGWLVDQSADTSRRREALEKAAFQTGVPLLSANTFYKDSLMDTAGAPVAVSNTGCLPKGPASQIDWSRARQPSFLKPYLIKHVAGLRVALIGIDNVNTNILTTADNVADLCFGDEEEHYKRIRKQLEGKADIFIMVVHDGDVAVIEKLTSPERLVDAVISGHTHQVYSRRINGVPYVQTGSGGHFYDRVDLVWDSSARKIVDARTQSSAGNPITGPHFNGAVQNLLEQARRDIAPFSGRPVGKAAAPITRDYINENALANLLTDEFRRISGTEIAFLNGGGIRANLPASDLSYEDFFKISPFSNRALILDPMPIENLIALLKQSIVTCGAYGALFQSGLTVSYRRHCTGDAKLDLAAKLLRVEQIGGPILYTEQSGINPQAPKHFRIATIDFLATGGDRFDGFKQIPIVKDLGILRELLVEDFVRTRPNFIGKIDGRWRNEDI